jgi:hypothetical protein
MFGPNASAPTTTSPFTIRGRSGAEVWLAFTIARCGEGMNTLSRLRIRFRVFGREQSPLIRLDPAVAAQCARHTAG